MKNKYKNAKEFIKKFKRSPLFTPQISLLINSGELTDITKARLKEYGIKPDFQSYYKNSQFLELSRKLNEEVRKKFGDLYSFTPDIKLKKLDFIPNTKTRSYAFGKLLLLTLSDQFQQETRFLRKKYKIPERGFRNSQEMDKKWSPCFSSSGFKRFIKDIRNLFRKYRLRLPLGIEVAYIFIKLNRKTFIKQLESYSSIIASIPFENLQLSLPDPYFPLENYLSVIAVTEPASKKQLISYINKNWQEIKKNMDRHFGRSALSRNFKRDFLIYSYYKEGKNIEEIRGLLMQYDFKNISKHQVKHTITRLKQRIRRLESRAIK